MKEIRIGLVGSGWMGKAHSSALADAEMLFGPDYGTASFEIVADANEEAAKSAQKKIGFKRISTDWHDVVTDPNVDLVDIATPNAFHYVVAILNNRFRNFFVYQSLEACILGTLCYIGMIIFNFPYAATISILIGFSAMIPVVGAYIGVTIGTILIMTHSVTLALLFVAYVVILQQFEGNLIYPYVVGGSTGLPGIWVILAITIGSALGGILGMLVSVPVAATLYQIVKDNVVRREEAKAANALESND